MNSKKSPKIDLETHSMTQKKSRPHTGTSLFSRPFALTPIRRSKKSSPARCRNYSKDFPMSPYVASPKKPKTFPHSSLQIERYLLKENIFAWNCKSLENKFTQIRPCVILKPGLTCDTQLFGFCDGENKESAADIVSMFLETIEKNPKFLKGGRRVLKMAYVETLGKLKKNEFLSTPHEICVVLLKNKKLSVFNLGTCGVLIGRKTHKGWESEVISNSLEKPLEETEKFLVLCNSSLLSTTSSSSISKVAGNYWEMKNPNIASWEITDLAGPSSSPLCLVIYLS